MVFAWLLWLNYNKNNLHFKDCNIYMNGHFDIEAGAISINLTNNYINPASI